MDDNQADYAKDTTTHLIEQLQASTGNVWKTYYQATPTTEPTSADYPLCIVQKRSGTAIIGPTQHDEIQETFQLTFALNIADDIGSANIRTTTMRHLENLIEGQDPNTQDFRSDSVLGVLRTYLTLGTWIINSDVTINYSQAISGKSNDGTLCLCTITMKVWRRVHVGRPLNIG